MERYIYITIITWNMGKYLTTPKKLCSTGSAIGNTEVGKLASNCVVLERKMWVQLWSYKI